jgi:hypothetical protein
LLGDLVEEVYLNAFERFAERPTDVPLSGWLEGLIDPSLKALLRHPDEEHENASLARTVRQAPRASGRSGQGGVDFAASFRLQSRSYPGRRDVDRGHRLLEENRHGRHPPPPQP